MSMKLILTAEVDGLGLPGDVVEVKPGYGRNYLVPRGLALRWTKGAETQIAQIRKARDARAVRDLGHAQEIAAQLKGLSVSVPARAGEGGRLFGSVSTAEIADAVKAAGGPLLDKHAVSVASPIKSVGSHTVEVKLHPEVTAEIALEVVPA
jgi:large subunit ribosomal protein L9